MILPENPPGFIIRTEVQKAAWDNGFRLQQGDDNGWLRFGSTTADIKVWIGGVPPAGPWLLAIDRADVAAELGAAQEAVPAGPGYTRYVFDNLKALYDALDRVYHLAVSLPDAPFARFEAQIKALARTTEAERLTIQRIGQNLFRAALMAYWGRRCPLTGIPDPALLRASHIVPWAECSSDAERLDVHNGLLLSSLWDAAFDAGLVGFGDDGSVLISPTLSDSARGALEVTAPRKLAGLSDAHRANLARHRQKYFLS